MTYSSTRANQIIVDRGSTHLDEIEIHVEVEPTIFSDGTRNLETIKKKIHDEIKSELGVGAVIKLVQHKSIERSMGKAKRVIDKRPFNLLLI